MNTEELIASGRLELYVSGSLSEAESAEIEQAVSGDTRLQEEVERIEAALITLAEAVAPTLSAMIWTYVLNSIRNVRNIDPSSQKTNWSAITGWAAALIAVAGIFWLLNENKALESTVEFTTEENLQLHERIDSTNTILAETSELLDVLRSREFDAITLPGNKAVAPDAYARVYFNKKDNIAYIDAKGLPDAPEGKVYQVWSLKLDPLTPTSVGLLDNQAEKEKGIYMFTEIADPEAFGITLEPAGGSKTPTLSQLYTLGTIAP